MIKKDTLKALLDVSQTLVSTLDIEKVNERILEEATEVLGADHGSLFLLDEKGGHLILTAARGFSEDQIQNIHLLGSWEKINQKVIKDNEPFTVNDTTKDVMFSKLNLDLTSFLSVPLKTQGKIVGVLNISNSKPNAPFNRDDERLLLALADYGAIAVLNARLYKKLEDLFFSTVMSLAAAVDAKDPYTHGHSERVMDYSVAIASWMKLPKDQIKDVKLAAILHDVGKIGISESVLGKEGSLTKEEFDEMKKHPSIGKKIVGEIMDSEDIIPGIADHHEKFDGSGYPNGLKGNEISLAGRIICIADSFDAMTSDRPYRKALTTQEALLELKNKAGTQFDPKAIEAFLKVYELIKTK